MTRGNETMKNARYTEKKRSFCLISLLLKTKCKKKDRNRGRCILHGTLITEVFRRLMCEWVDTETIWTLVTFTATDFSPLLRYLHSGGGTYYILHCSRLSRFEQYCPGELDYYIIYIFGVL